MIDVNIPKTGVCARIVGRDPAYPLDASLLVHKLKVALALRERLYREPFYRLRTGWCIMMLGLILGGATVTYFGRMLPLFFFFTAIGGVLATCRSKAPAPEARALAARDVRPPAGRAQPVLPQGRPAPAASW